MEEDFPTLHTTLAPEALKESSNVGGRGAIGSTSITAFQPETAPGARHFPTGP